MTFKKWQQMTNTLTNYPRDELSLIENSKQSSRASIAPTSSAISEEKLEVSIQLLVSINLVLTSFSVFAS